MRSKNDWLDYLEHNALYHYGVMGMKWGVRRYQPYSTVPRRSGKGGKEVGAAKKKETITNSNDINLKEIAYKDRTFYVGQISFGNNPKCSVQLDDKSEKLILDKIINNKRLELDMRNKAADGLYNPHDRNLGSKEEFRKKLKCVDISIYDGRKYGFPDSETDVQVVYAYEVISSAGDLFGDSWGFNLDSKTGKILNSEWFDW